MNESIVIRLQSADIYQKSQLILPAVNMEIRKGEFVYLTGKVGSGKTSIIKTLYAELPLQRGQGWVYDFALHEIQNKEVPFLRRQLGIVFQDFQLLTDRNVYENLKLVLRATGYTDRKKMEERIDEVLYETGMNDKKESMPHELSGGEQQRVVISRALLNKPDIILADEPTGNLDPQTSETIMHIFKTICDNGQTVFMATHNYGLIEKFEGRVLKIGENQLISE